MRAKIPQSDLPEEEKRLWARIDALCGELIVLRGALKKIHDKVYSPFARKIAGEALAKQKKMQERRIGKARRV